MKLATSVTYTRTIQMSATSTATVTATMTAEPEPGDDYSSPEDVAAITATLWPLARAAVREQLEAVIVEKRDARAVTAN